MDRHQWNGDQFVPFLPTDYRHPNPVVRSRDEIDKSLMWGTLPFAPRVDLHPVPLRFEEFISWCPEAKFESFDGRLSIGGASDHVMGILVMTLGMQEIARLAHPHEWVTFLFPERLAVQVERETQQMMWQATFRPFSGAREEPIVVGELKEPPRAVYEATEAEARQMLTDEVRNTVLTRLSRQLE